MNDKENETNTLQGDKEKLVDDATFLRLIEREFDQKGEPVDQLGASRVWAKVSAAANKGPADTAKEESPSRPFGDPLPGDDGKRNEDKIRRWQWAGLLAAGLAGLIAVSHFFRPPVDEGQQIKGDGAIIDLRIGYYLRHDDGELVAWNPSMRKVGDVVVPFVELFSPAAVVLLKKIGLEQYEAVSDAEWAEAGEEHYFSIEGASAAVELESETEAYCVVATPDMPLMGQIIAELPNIDQSGRDLALECFDL